MARIALRKPNLQTRIRSNPVGLHVCFFGQALRLLPYFMCAKSEGAVSLCNKYQGIDRLNWKHVHATSRQIIK